MRGNSGVDNYARGLAQAAGADILTLEGNIASGAFQWLPNVGGTGVAITTDAPEGFVGYQDGASYALRVINPTGSIACTINIGGAGIKSIYTGAVNKVHSFAGAVMYITYSSVLDRFVTQESASIVSAGVKLSGAATGGSSPAKSSIDHNHGSAIVGVTDGTSALAGDVGEYKHFEIGSASAFTLTTATLTEVCRLTLTPGDWDVSSKVGFYNALGGRFKYFAGGVGTSLAMSGLRSQQIYLGDFRTNMEGGNVFNSVTPPTVDYNLAVNTDIILMAESWFDTAACFVYGEISARRTR